MTRVLLLIMVFILLISITNSQLQPVEKVLDDGSIMKIKSLREFSIIKGDTEFNITSSVDGIQIGDITKTKRIDYGFSGYASIKSNSKLHIVGDYIVSDSCRFFNYTKECDAWLIGKAFENETIEFEEDITFKKYLVDVQIPTREFQIINDYDIGFSWEGYLDPTFTTFTSSTVCNSPNICTNITIYHNNLTLNVTPAETAPLVYFPFDIGNVSEDLMDNSGATFFNNAKLNTTNCFSGNCVDVQDQSDSYLNVPGEASNEVLEDNSDFCIESWFMKTNAAGGGRLAAKLDSGTNRWGIELSSDERVYLTVREDGSTTGFRTNAAAYSNDVWVHVVVCYDISTNIKTVSVNGVNQSSGGTNTVTLNGDLDILYIGAECDGSDEFPGFIDEFKIYNYLLTTSQITTHYQEGIRTKKGIFEFNQSTTDNRFNVSLSQTLNVSGLDTTFAYKNSSTSCSAGFTSYGTESAANSNNHNLRDSDVCLGGRFTWTSDNSSKFMLMTDWTIDTWDVAVAPTTQTPTPTADLLNISQNNESIQLNASNGCAEKCLIYQDGVNVKNISSFPDNITGLTNFTSFSFNFTVFNDTFDIEESNFSNTITTTTSQNVLGPPPVQTPTPTADLLNISFNNESVQLNASSSCQEICLLYQDGVNVINFSNFPFNRTGLTNFTSVSFNFTVFNSSNGLPESNFSNTITTTTAQNTPGVAPPPVAETSEPEESVALLIIGVMFWLVHVGFKIETRNEEDELLPIHSMIAMILFATAGIIAYLSIQAMLGMALANSFDAQILAALNGIHTFTTWAGFIVLVLAMLGMLITITKWIFVMIEENVLK